jgi:hypothetical protein
MTRFNLPENFLDNPEAILRSRARTTSSCTTSPPPTENLIYPTPSATTIMAKTLCKYSIPNVDDVPTRPAVNVGDENFELHTGLITMV